MTQPRTLRTSANSYWHPGLTEQQLRKIDSEIVESELRPTNRTRILRGFDHDPDWAYFNALDQKPF
jgi:hypothetical protein